MKLIIADVKKKKRFGNINDENYVCAGRKFIANRLIGSAILQCSVLFGQCKILLAEQYTTLDFKQLGGMLGKFSFII